VWPGGTERGCWDAVVDGGSVMGERELDEPSLPCARAMLASSTLVMLVRLPLPRSMGSAEPLILLLFEWRPEAE
jgi:hypothetical protein